MYPSPRWNLTEPHTIIESRSPRYFRFPESGRGYILRRLMLISSMQRYGDLMATSLCKKEGRLMEVGGVYVSMDAMCRGCTYMVCSYTKKFKIMCWICWWETDTCRLFSDVNKVLTRVTLKLSLRSSVHRDSHDIPRCNKYDVLHVSQAFRGNGHCRKSALVSLTWGSIATWQILSRSTPAVVSNKLTCISVVVMTCLSIIVVE